MPAHERLLQARAAERGLEFARDGAASDARRGVAACAREAGLRFDALAELPVRELRSQGSVACAAGCSSCCHLDVVVTLPEVAALAEAVEALPQPAREGVRARLRSRVAELASGGPVARAGRGRPCVLLEDDRCLAYEARPLACRGWTSADAAACVEALRTPSEPPSIPVHAPLRTLALELARGVSDAAREQGLDEGPLDLAPALHALFEDPAGWTARWLEGAMLPEDWKAVAAPRRMLCADGRWRFGEEAARSGPGG